MSHTPLSGISVCVFDAYGTLFDLSALGTACRGVLGDKTDKLLDLWRRKQLEYSWLRSLMGRHTDFWHVTGESLDYAMKALGVDDVGLRTRLMEAYLTPAAFPDAKPALQALKGAGHKLAILSNGSPTMLISATKAAGLDLLMTEVLSAEDVGIFKPHPSVYRTVLERFECEPTAVAFVSSNGWDAAGAAAFGFHAVWVNRARAPREALPASPHLEVERLTGLCDLIRA